MAFSIPSLVATALGRPPRLVCGRRVWDAGVAELRRRADGRRESGAFLLGHRGRRVRRVDEFVFYDDVDPGCLRNGIVEIDGSRLGVLWRHCRERGLKVVADVHVHPGGYGQSASDQANPVMLEAGHLAIILPHYAVRRTRPGGIGLYEHLGARRWVDHSRRASSFFHVGWRPSWL